MKGEENRDVSHRGLAPVVAVDTEGQTAVV